jgi:Ca2+-binding EF-hand superfamily protein
LHQEAVRDLKYTGWQASDADIEMFIFVNQTIKDGVVRLAPGVFNTAKPSTKKKSKTHSTNKLNQATEENKSVPLRTLDCSHCALLSDASMQLVGHWCPMLLSLRMTHTAITDAGLDSVLIRCHNLEVLDFSHCLNLSERAIVAVTRFVQQQLLRGFLKDDSKGQTINLFAGGGINGESSDGDRGTKTNKKQQAVGRGLRELRLAGCERAVDDKNVLQMLGVLQESPTLTTVDLGSCAKLTDMSMYNCAIPQGKMQQKRHPMRQSIKSLNFSGITCTSSGMEWIALACSRLQRLDLSHAKGSGIGFSLRLLSNRIPKLEELILRGCTSLAAADVRHFFHTTERGGKVRAEQARTLFESEEGGGEDGGGSSGLMMSLPLSEQQMARTWLRKLDLCGCCSLDDSAIEALARCLANSAGGHLQELSLEGVTNLHDRSLTQLAYHCGAGLTKLRLGGNTKYASAGVAGAKNSGGLFTRFTNATLAALGTHCRKLQHLSIAYSPKIDDQGMEALFGSNARGGDSSLRMKAGKLGGAGTGGSGVGATLQELDISNCPYLGEGTAMAVGQFCPDLRVFEATSVGGLTDRGMVVIVQQCPQLHSMLVAYCPLLSDMFLHAIARSPNGTCARLKVLCLGGLASGGPGGEGAGAGGGGEGQAGQITDAGFLSLTTHAKASQDAMLAVLKAKAAKKGRGWRAEMRAKESAKQAAKKMFAGRGRFGKGLDHNGGTDAEGMQVQHGACLQLERLQLSGLRKISDVTLNGLRECGCTSLTRLDLHGCDPVNCTPTAVARLCSANPWAKIYVGNEPTTLGMVPVERWIHPQPASSVPTIAPKPNGPGGPGGGGGSAASPTKAGPDPTWECPSRVMVEYAMLKRDQWRGAITIQCMYRSVVARMSSGALERARQKKREHKAATKIASKKRANDAWKKYGPIIQARVQARIEEVRYQKMIHGSAKMIQQRFKHWMGQRKMAMPVFETMRAEQIYRDRVHKGAMGIQTAWRGYATRKDFAPLLAMKRNAAIKIQGMIRGYQGRKHATAAIAEAMHRHKCAQKIQKMYRFWLLCATMRYRAAELGAAITPIQASFRMHMARRWVSKLYVRRFAAAKLLRRALLPLMLRYKWRRKIEAVRLYEGRVARYKLGPWFQRRKEEMEAWKAKARQRVRRSTAARTIQEKFAWPIIVGTRLALIVQRAWRSYQARGVVKGLKKKIAWEQYRRLAQNPIVQQGACILLQAWWRPHFQRHVAVRIFQYHWRTHYFFKAEKKRKAELEAEQADYDDYYATLVQKRWRGHWLRESRFRTRRKREIYNYSKIKAVKRIKMANKEEKRLDYREVFFREYAVKRVQRHVRAWLDSRPRPVFDIRNREVAIREGIKKAPHGIVRMHANHKRDREVKRLHKAKLKEARKLMKEAQKKNDMLGLRKKEKIALIKFPPEEIESALYSCAYRQNKTMEGSGVVDIWLTVGNEEAHQFKLAQKERQKLGKPVFHKIDVDLLEKPLGELKRARNPPPKSKRQLLLDAETEKEHAVEVAQMAGASLPEQYQSDWRQKEAVLEEKKNTDTHRSLTQLPKHVYLWVAHGTGLSCIVEMRLRKRTARGMAAQVTHKRKVKAKGYAVRWQMQQSYTCPLEINYKNKFSHYVDLKGKHSSTAGGNVIQATELMKFEKRMQKNRYFDGTEEEEDANAIGNDGPGVKKTVLQAVKKKDERMPILNIAISKNKADEVRLEKMGFEVFEHEWGGTDRDTKTDLGAVGCQPGARLWTQRRKPKLTTALKRALGEIEKEPWFDHNVSEAVTFCAFESQDVLAFREVFSAIDVTNAGMIDVAEFYFWLDVERSAWGDDFFALFDENNSGVVNFGEFVHAMTAICMMESNEIMHFIFHMMDKRTEGRITQNQFDQCIRRLGMDNSLINTAMMIHRGNDYFNREKVIHQGGYMSYHDFEDTIKNFPTVYLPVEELKAVICDNVLGLPFWNYKKELFAEARQKMREKDKAARFQVQSHSESKQAKKRADKDHASSGKEGESEAQSQQDWLHPVPPPPPPDEEEGLMRGAKIGHMASAGNAGVHARIVGLKADMYGDGHSGDHHKGTGGLPKLQ